MKFNITALVLCIIWLFPVHTPAQSLQELNALQSQFQSLYNAHNFDQVLAEADKRLLINPEDVFARGWQAYIYLTRDDTLNKQVKMRQRLKHLRYNFWLIEENIRFLNGARSSDPIAEKIRNAALKAYHQLYASLKIRLSDTELIGFYRTSVNMRLISPFLLKRNQEKRLAEINESLARGATLHFSTIDKQTNSFIAELAGVPLLNQFEAGYMVEFPQSGDTLFVEFNPEFQDVLTIPATAIDSAYYDLPPDYLLLFFDNDKIVHWGQPGKTVYSKTIGDKTGYLFPLQQMEDIRIDDRIPIWRRAITWSALGIMTIFLLMTIK